MAMFERGEGQQGGARFGMGIYKDSFHSESVHDVVNACADLPTLIEFSSLSVYLNLISVQDKIAC